MKVKRSAKQSDNDVVMGDYHDGAPPVPPLQGSSRGETGEVAVDELQTSPTHFPSASSEKNATDLQQKIEYWSKKAEEMKNLLDAEQARRSVLEGKLQEAGVQTQDLKREAENRIFALQNELHIERSCREQTQYSLQEERRRREEAQNDLEQNSNEALDFQRRWKQAARELNDMHLKQQGFNIVTNDYLVQRVKALRYDIQTFAIQFYGEKAPVFMKFEMGDYIANLLNSVENLESDLFSQERRATAIQSIIWRILVDYVFDEFVWLGRAARHLVRDLHGVLRPKWQGVDNYTGPRDAFAERKFQLWSASTAALLVDLDSNRQDSPDSTISAQNREDRLLFKTTLRFLEKIPTVCDYHRLKQGLFQIPEDAIALDMEISGQVARIEWDSNRGHTNMKLDPRFMTVAKDQTGSATTDDVRLVIAPRMVKRGKSTGEDFEAEYQLVPMEVSLMLASKNGGGDGGVKAEVGGGGEGSNRGFLTRAERRMGQLLGLVRRSPS